MRISLGLAILLGCASSPRSTTTQPTEEASAPAPVTSPVGGQMYGGQAYGGSIYGDVADDAPVADGGIPLGTGTGTGYSGPTRAHGPLVRILPLAVEGELPKEVVRRYVVRHRGKLNYCYQQEVATTPALAGSLTVSFSIDEQGKVSTADMTTTLGAPAMQTCMIKAIKSIEFPKLAKGVAKVTMRMLLQLPPA